MAEARTVVWRISLALLGTGLVLAGAAAAFALVPGSLQAEPGDGASTTEEVRYWRPGDGWQNAARTRILQVEEGAKGLVAREQIQGPASPRGTSFLFPIDATYQLDAEQGVRVTFPPTPYLQEPRDDVYLAVPWRNATGAFAGAIDHFELTGTESREGLDLLRYQAEHDSQFYVEENGLIWYRATQRTALVEAMTGTVVAYDDHETLWTQKQPAGLYLPLLRDTLSPPERVWEAHAGSSAHAEAQQADAARQAREDYHWRMALYGLPLVVLGEIALWSAATGGGVLRLRS